MLEAFLMGGTAPPVIEASTTFLGARVPQELVCSMGQKRDNPYQIRNTGEGIITSCVISPTIPAGLSIGPIDNHKGCEITGTPTRVTAAMQYTITITTNTGTDTAQLEIEVVAPPSNSGG